jgi:CxxC-x17-CxxC domain-containing protein
MHQGNWTCSTCGGAITQLPFEPRSESGLTCSACYAKSKGGDVPDSSQSSNQPSGEKPKVAGAWTCSGCGAPITSLPFTPRDTSNLKCLDCFKKSKA